MTAEEAAAATTSTPAASNQTEEEDDGRRSSSLIIFDGGTGREIERRGGPFRQPEWSALSLYEDPALVQNVHESYLEAGATAITTNSYAVVPFHLGRERYDRDAAWLLRLSVDLAHRAVAAHQGKTKKNDDEGEVGISVIGSIPPLCGSYEPDRFDPAVAGPILRDFMNAYRDRVDILLLETVGSSAEAKFYLESIRPELTTSWKKPVPIWISFCVESERGIMHQTPHLLTGDTLPEAVHQLTGAGLLDDATAVPVLLVNCCDVRLVTASVEQLMAALPPDKGVRVGAYPNAFSVPPPDAANHTLRQVDFNITPAVLKAQAQEWVQRGATVLGGCCGVGPEHIRAMASLKTPE